LRAFLAAGWVLAGLLAAPAAASPADLELLREHGLEPEPGSLARFLRGLYAGPEETRAAEVEVARLSSPAAPVRDAAALHLTVMGVRAAEVLERAAESPDPETRRAAAYLLERVLAEAPRHVLLAALRTVVEARLPGLAPQLVRVHPVSRRFFFEAEVEAALLATVTRDDLPWIRATVATDGDPLQSVAVLALGSVLEGDGTGELHALLHDRPDGVRINAAWVLADRGDRACLPVFGELLGAPDPGVRQRAARALRHVSGETFGFAASAEPAKRAAAAAAWRDWIATKGPAAHWTTPLAPPPADRGRTLVSIYHEDRVVEYDRSGRLVWEMRAILKPWAAQGLPNGHRLVVHYPGKTLVEYDDTGRVVWRREGLPGFVGGVQRLENGNTLLAVTNPDRLMEIRPGERGSVAWQLELPGRPTDARLLESGNLLVTLGQAGRVVEMDRAGKELWALTDLLTPYTARRLPDGNTLVAEYGTGRVVEFDPAGTKVWEYTELDQCYTAERLPDGRTLVADRQGVREVDRSGQVLWIHRNEDGKGFLRATRY